MLAIGDGRIRIRAAVDTLASIDIPVTITAQ
jgi:hypothetical protein